ncbi:hypothetical protein, partial [Arenibaculum sp.]|uniref:hypothetical protein n=1 Tax=Arenibaculum sp. TaxID=2865862 RepID=UPI002E152F5D|nr:hypothetical protein [Arenibaculum sp.]
LALVTSGLPKDTQAVIRGKKRPCFGCWLCLSFAKEVLGYSGLNFNENPGKAWKNSIDSLSNLVNLAVQRKISEKVIDRWASEKMGLHKKDQLYTYISSGFLGVGQDQGYDTESDDESH